MADDNNDQVLMVLGEIKGELAGIHRLVKISSDATNRRIEDLKESVHQRIEDEKLATDQRFESVNKTIVRRGVGAGASAGAMISFFAELVKDYLK